VGALKKSNVAHWWSLLAVGGAIIAAAFFVAQLIDGFLLGLGLLLFGAGERIKHHRCNESMRYDVVESCNAYEMKCEEANCSALLLDAFGIELVVVGLLLAVFAP
jgi:hypothetical protein